MSPFTFIFIGRSGCGKGTQAGLLQEELKAKYGDNPIFYLETGQRFRDFIQQDNYSSSISKKIYESIEPQPSFLAIWMWSHLLVDNLKGNEHLVIDGTPRSYSDALVLTSAMKFYGRKAHVIYLNVSRKWSEDRLMGRGRADDVKPEDIKKRMDWFDKDVMPAVEYFKYNSDFKFIDINGERTIDEIHTELMSRLAI